MSCEERYFLYCLKGVERLDFIAFVRPQVQCFDILKRRLVGDEIEERLEDEMMEREIKITDVSIFNMFKVEHNHADKVISCFIDKHTSTASILYRGIRLN